MGEEQLAVGEGRQGILHFIGQLLGVDGSQIADEWSAEVLEVPHRHWNWRRVGDDLNFRGQFCVIDLADVVEGDDEGRSVAVQHAAASHVLVMREVLLVGLLDLEGPVELGLLEAGRRGRAFAA